MKAVIQLINFLELIAIILVLVLALIFQFAFHELPCPLCLLQRVGFFGIAFSFLLNCRFGLRPSHYALATLSALFTAMVALRQVALHVVPGTGGYGPAVFGFHMYTWSFFIAFIILVVTAIIQGIDPQYFPEKSREPRWKGLAHFLFAVLMIVVLINLVSVFAECGLAQCPDNPVKYLF